jgi:hypothetical protein
MATTCLTPESPTTVTPGDNEFDWPGQVLEQSITPIMMSRAAWEASVYSNQEEWSNDADPAPKHLSCLA